MSAKSGIGLNTEGWRIPLSLPAACVLRHSPAPGGSILRRSAMPYLGRCRLMRPCVPSAVRGICCSSAFRCPAAGDALCFHPVRSKRNRRKLPRPLGILRGYIRLRRPIPIPSGFAGRISWPAVRLLLCLPLLAPLWRRCMPSRLRFAFQPVRRRGFRCRGTFAVSFRPFRGGVSYACASFQHLMRLLAVSRAAASAFCLEWPK